MILFKFIVAIILALAVCELLFFDITGLGRRKAQREFPAAAKQFGFVRQKSRASKPIGDYAGDYRGYHFFIEPDRNATIQLQMKPLEGLEELMTRKGASNFESGDASFDGLFKTRRASAEMAGRIQGAPEFLQFAAQFAGQWRWKANYIQVYPDAIYCSLKYGNGRFIPASVLEKIIPEMVTFADLLQSATQNA